MNQRCKKIDIVKIVSGLHVGDHVMFVNSLN